jgi:hypothetical protein
VSALDDLNRTISAKPPDIVTWADGTVTAITASKVTVQFDSGAAQQMRWLNTTPTVGDVVLVFIRNGSPVVIGAYKGS